MQRPVAAANLFVPGFRPADKNVWNGSAFEVAPAGQLAYMIHPQTGRRMMVAEPTATNIITNSGNFSNTLWPGGSIGRQAVDGIFPGLSGWKLTNNGVSGSSSVGATFGVIPSSAQTMYAVIGREDSDTVMLGIQDPQASSWVAACQYQWSTDQVTVFAVSSNVTFGRIKLLDDTVLLWTSSSAPVNPGNSRAVRFYPGWSGPGLSSRLYHLQLEDSLYWTSPIVTSATAISRAGDVLRIDDYDHIIGPQFYGTFYAEIAYPSGRRADNAHYTAVESADGVTANSIIYYITGNENLNCAAIFRKNGVTVGVQASPPTPLTTNPVKTAHSFSGSLRATAINGAVSDGAVTIEEVPLNRLSLAGSAGGVVVRPLWLSKITRDSRIRTAAELEALTS